MGYIGKRTKEMVQEYGIDLEIVKRPRKYFWVPADVDVKEYMIANQIEPVLGFKVLPRRWVVERTFAWLGKYRRLSKDYEYDIDMSETTIIIAATRTMLRRLHRFLC